METIVLTNEMIAVLAILAFTIFLFAFEVVRVDVAALSVLVILGLSLLSPSALLLARRLLHGVCRNWFGGEGLLASMNLSQNVGRNALAVSSLAIAFMMVISMSIMVHSFRQTVIVWIEQTSTSPVEIRLVPERN